MCHPTKYHITYSSLEGVCGQHTDASLIEMCIRLEIRYPLRWVVDKKRKNGLSEQDYNLGTFPLPLIFKSKWGNKVAISVKSRCSWGWNS